jgi:hypothetical protein
MDDEQCLSREDVYLNVCRKSINQSAQGSLEAVCLLHLRLTSIHSWLLIVNLFGAEDPPLYLALLL